MSTRERKPSANNRPKQRSTRLTAAQYQAKYGRGRLKPTPQKEQPKSHKYKARAVVRYGIRFPSTAEADFYTTLVQNRIPFEHQKVYYLTETFKYLPDERTTSKRRVTPDYFLPIQNLIIDVKGGKGQRTADAVLRFVLLKNKLKDLEHPPAILWVPKNDINKVGIILGAKGYRLDHVKEWRFV